MIVKPNLGLFEWLNGKKYFNLKQDLQRSSVEDASRDVPLLWDDYNDGFGNYNIHYKLGMNLE